MQQRTVVAVLGLCGLAMLIAQALPARAGEIDTQLFGKDPGAARAAACFVRHYDAAHLKSHPQQNVTDMTVLVDGTMDADERSYMVSLGVNFRGLKQQMQASGYCGSIEAGTQVLGCGIDCDGGTIGVRLKDANAVLIDIPDGASTWDPTAPLDAEPGDVPEQAHFGSDDRTFRLDRADLAQCLALAYDDELKSIISAAK